jgi:c-di-AMP phosphodiesterase-like protein
MKIKDFLLINIPVWLFIFFGLCSLILSFFISSIFKFILLGFTWWCLCGAFFVFKDYKRKKRQFLKILSQSKNDAERLKRLTLPLKDTICGLSLCLALNHRFKNRMN